VTDLRLDLLRRSYAGFNAMDPEAISVFWHADCEWHMGDQGLADPVFHGHDGIRAFIGEIATIADGIESEILEVRDDGGNLLIRGVNSFHIRDHDVDATNQPFGQVAEFRDGLIFRITQTDDPPPGWESAAPIE
jgi:hypothetical protein